MKEQVLKIYPEAIVRKYEINDEFEQKIYFIAYEKGFPISGEFENEINCWKDSLRIINYNYERKKYFI